MSKRQNLRHEQSIVRIASYESISPAEKKKGFTRPSLVSCKRVKKEGTLSIANVMASLSRKFIYVDPDVRTVDVRNAVGVGIGTKGKIQYLKNYHGFLILTK